MRDMVSRLLQQQSRIANMLALKRPSTHKYHGGAGFLYADLFLWFGPSAPHLTP